MKSLRTLNFTDFCYVPGVMYREDRSRNSTPAQTLKPPILFNRMLHSKRGGNLRPNSKCL